MYTNAGKCLSQTYTLEYGTDRLEIQDMSVSPGARVMIVDDLLATGGTMKTACDLIKKVGGVVDHCWVVMELAALGGRGKVGETVEALITLADVV